MSIIEALLQGILQGLTEFLPVSSSGHLSIFQYFTGQSGEAGALFSIVLHFGTLIAVTLAFWPRIWRLITGFFAAIGDMAKGKFDIKRPNATQKEIMLLIVGLLPLMLTFVIKDWLQGFSSDADIAAEGIFLMITGIALFLAARHSDGRKKVMQMTYKDALIIGLCQAIAPLPGISRSGITLAAALLLGLDKKFAISYSFILGIPAVCGAVILDIKDILGMTGDMGVLPLVIGFVTSAVVGILAIRLMRFVVANDHLNIFSAYTLVVGAVVFALGIYDHLSGGHLMGIIQLGPGPG